MFSREISRMCLARFQSIQLLILNFLPTLQYPTLSARHLTGGYNLAESMQTKALFIEVKKEPPVFFTHWHSQDIIKKEKNLHPFLRPSAGLCKCKGLQKRILTTLLPDLRPSPQQCQLILSQASSPKEKKRTFLPQNGSALVFRLNTTSLHSLILIMNCPAYTLVNSTCLH